MCHYSMWPNWVLNQGLLAFESDTLQTALCRPVQLLEVVKKQKFPKGNEFFDYIKTIKSVTSGSFIKAKSG